MDQDLMLDCPEMIRISKLDAIVFSLHAQRANILELYVRLQTPNRFPTRR